ncbi:MAG: amidohydrolase family protein, partial [Nocardioides sp.]
VPATPGLVEIRAEDRWLIPGLWDAHVHFAQWADTLRRIDLVGTESAAAVLAEVAAYHAARDRPGRPADGVVVGFGYRSATWVEPPTVAALDAVCGDTPVVLIAGDFHNGWLSSAALRLVGLPPRSGALQENEWFAISEDLDRVLPSGGDRALAHAQRHAAAHGVVGIVDMEFDRSFARWPERVAAGHDLLRVRPATYLGGLDEVLAAGLRSGDRLDELGLVRMGSLKIISDGSLNTRSAFCHEPYAATSGPAPTHPTLHQGEIAEGAPRYGALNLDSTDLRAALTRAARGGLTVALHAIGDAAVDVGLDCFAATGASGSIEHAQLLTSEAVQRMAGLGLVASVQPAHLLDDRDPTEACWPGRAHRCFAFRELLDAGVSLALGSDAPVARLDPWLAMAAAVHRSADERPPWVPEQAITAADALAASTDGHGTVGVSSPADLALLDSDPLGIQEDSAAVAEHFRRLQVAVTIVGGRITHDVR